MTDNLKNLAESLRKFADERNWEQFHSPKNPSMALTVEAAELMANLDDVLPRQLLKMWRAGVLVG